MSESEKTYTNGEITVIWKPGVCIHSAKCVQGLGEVFQRQQSPVDQHGRLWNRPHHQTGRTSALPSAQLFPE